MSTWLDTQDPDKVATAMSGFLATDRGQRFLTDYAGGDQRFALWLNLVDRQVSRICGLGFSDLADFNSRDAYDAGTSPREAARECLEHDDTFGPLMAMLD